RAGVIAAEEPGRGQQREVLQPGDLPDLLDVPGLLLHPVVDAEGVAAGGGATAGHRVVEPVGFHHVGPGYAQHFPLTPHTLPPPARGTWAAAARMAVFASAGPRAAVPGGRMLGKRRWPAGDGASAAAAICSRLTCLRDQVTWSAWSRARHATSAGDICRARC